MQICFIQFCSVPLLLYPPVVPGTQSRNHPNAVSAIETRFENSHPAQEKPAL